LELAKRLDPNDPTAWLYSALVKAEHNRINEAILDFERSRELNNNRQLYRSEFLLDQDAAVGSVNLARILQDAGMVEWSTYEAGRAINYDYANYSAHLFLANSYDALRDPNRINLRYETPAESEYLIANLLAPVGAGLLSQSISQQEYAKLLERDRLGVVSTTEYLSRGAWRQAGAQYGTFGNSSYAFEGLYHRDAGQRPNNDFEETELRLHLKQQVGAQDTFYLRGIFFDADGGDLIQRADPNDANLGIRVDERQEPVLHLGYHHEWAPGSHTLLLLGRVDDKFLVMDPRQPTYFVIKRNGVRPSFIAPLTIEEMYRSKLELYSGELQQIWQTPVHTVIGGVRLQTGDFRTYNLQTHPAAGDLTIFFPTNGPAALQNFQTDFHRISIYGYHSFRVLDDLQLVAGITYENLTYPANLRAAPLSSGEETLERLLPKAGFIWTPQNDTAVRFAYTRSLGGAGIDQTFLLEPSQVAGFNQSFRSIIPESVSGAQAGAEFETFGLVLEHQFPRHTYAAISGEILRSDLNRTIGIFSRRPAIDDFAIPDTTRERVDFEERVLLITVDKLLGEEWAVGAHYRITDAELTGNFREIPDDVSNPVPSFRPRQHLESTLHQLTLQAVWNHRSGLFAQVQALWNVQNSSGYLPPVSGENFWQANLFAGYRIPRRKAEFTVGLLNVTDREYRLNPLTLHNDLPRERTLVARFGFSF
jgi:hypothetical protein